jgi:hypothetical protein
MSQRNFQKEISLLNQIYDDMIEASHNEPDFNDVESMRLYIENSFRIFNRTIFRINEVKNALMNEEKLDSSTWNPPA